MAPWSVGLAPPSAGNGLNSLLFPADSQLQTTCTLDAPDLAQNNIGADGLSRSQMVKLCSKKAENSSLPKSIRKFNSGIIEISLLNLDYLL